MNPAFGSRSGRAAKFGLAAAFLCCLAGGGLAAGIYAYFSSTLPELPDIADFRPAVATLVFSTEGRVIAEFAAENRKVLPPEKIPPLLARAFIAGEDKNFFKHAGIDIEGILRAAIANIKAGEIVQGGSTITQQVAKALLSTEKTFSRKFREAILARRMERKYTKEEILYLYLNSIYLGRGAYGVQAAGEIYFGKNAWELDLAETAILAGLPQAPSKYSPFRHPERAKQRQRYVLSRMVEEGYATAAEAEQAAAEEVRIQDLPDYFHRRSPHFAEMVRRYIADTYGEEALYKGGLRIYATVESDKQFYADAAVKKGLDELDKRQGYAGPLLNLGKDQQAAFIEKYSRKLGDRPLEMGAWYAAVVTAVNDAKGYAEVAVGGQKGKIPIGGMSWARKPNPEVHYESGRIDRPGAALRAGDVVLARHVDTAYLEGYGPPALRRNIPNGALFVLEQDPRVEGALLSADVRSGYVLAMVGGYDYRRSEFNRAYQACRQPGSSFKPLYYAAAIEKLGYTPSTILIDSPIVYDDSEFEKRWKPQNYGEDFKGDVPLRTAIINSMNVPSIKVMDAVTPREAAAYARRLGITTELKHDLSLALGSSCVTLWDMASVYALFARHGTKSKLKFIKKIVDRDGKVIEENVSPADPWLDPIEKLAAGFREARTREERVIDEKSGFILTQLLHEVVLFGTGAAASRLGKPAAGKTGTTNDSFDAWFMGFTPEVVTGAWVGFDTYEMPLGRWETGSRAALPIWLDYMVKTVGERPASWYAPPEKITRVRIDPATGLLARPETMGAVEEYYIQNTEPKDFAPKAGVAERDAFFKVDMEF